VDSNGNWALNLFLNQGSNTIKFFARDTAGNISSSTEVSFFIDSTAPVIDSFSILECEQSLSASGCLLLPPPLHLIWQIPAEDLDYFELNINKQLQVRSLIDKNLINEIEIQKWKNR